MTGTQTAECLMTDGTHAPAEPGHDLCAHCELVLAAYEAEQDVPTAPLMLVECPYCVPYVAEIWSAGDVLVFADHLYQHGLAAPKVLLTADRP